ncbi:unnamed protein product [Chilo suppressalis]|uniref:Uncharacterized protein n=1 Tax=Chilo suppressalis TaxID=168631 RepID=A0ABN8L8B9_CHISP|nr:hypothetical protein evm_008396 [Chilo suppressalis]CAH2987557.1 unnamed protein product [Chilo suppressalis]
MSSPVVSDKNKHSIIDPGLCRCCRSIKKCRVLTLEYDWRGHKEVYSDMFMDCFGLMLSHLDGDTKECGVCATCVARLRDASAFRHQVLQCEQMFLASRLDTKEELTSKIEVEVKPEPVCDDCESPDDDDMDNEDPDYTEAVEEPQESKDKLPEVEEVKPRTRQQTKKTMKRNLLSKVHRLSKKLEKMLEKPEEPIPQKREKEPKPPPKAKKKSPSDRDHMIYMNAVTIVQNSYVCPFQNRISNYYCYYCKDQFVNPNELRDHTLSHDTGDFENMMENKKIPKIDITRIDCRLCDTKIGDIETFKRHISTVHEKNIHQVDNEFLKFRLTPNNLSCTECGSVFPYFDMLKKHMVEHFGTFICDQCGACFLEQNSLRTHIKSHSRVETNFPCDICGKNLKSKYSRYLHVATVHEKKPTVNCYKCEASFLSYALRNRHLIEVHGDKRTFPCKLCDKVYNRRKTLMEHNRRNHLKVYRHQCDLCDQRFYLPSRLKEHMATHTGERNYRCDLCDKTYPRLQSLQEHMRAHTNDRRYKCDICNSAFTQNGSLKNHMKTHHQGYDLDTNFS